MSTVRGNICFPMNEEQWWITGFNPKYKNPDPDVMVSIVTIDLSEHTEFFEALKNTDEDTNYIHDIHKDNLIFDDTNKTVWIQ